MKRTIASAMAAAAFAAFAQTNVTGSAASETDADWMEDFLERAWPEFGARPGVYDAHTDPDEDGWSSFAETRARWRRETARASYAGHPQPTVTMDVRYNGYASLAGKALTVEAYTDPVCARRDAKFSVPFAEGEITLPTPSEGWLREGPTTFMVFAGAPGAGPAGVARNVDVGWSGGRFEVVLSESSPVCPVMDVSGIATNDWVYVYRYSVDGVTPPSSLDNGPVLVVTNLGARTYLTESDFLSDKDFDLDWTGFQECVMENRTVGRLGLPVTSVVYRVYGKGMDLDAEYAPSNSNGVHASYVEIVKNFGLDRATAVPVAPGEDSTIFYKPQPTFRWRMEGDSPDTFTAFKIEVADNSGTVWDSGFRHAPRRNARGEYVWQAPLYMGDQAAAGKVFQANANYKWTVSMYNSKYQSDAWSGTNVFRVAEASISNRLAVGVRYYGQGMKNAGPANTNGVLRVEAFASPDFSGEPAGRTYVANFTAVTNATIIGLEPGTYYVRAYLDSDGDFRRSAWESWGYACMGAEAEYGAVFEPARFTVGGGVAPPLAVIFVEDCDTDQDGLPDVREWDAAGVDKTGFLLKKGPGDTF